MNPVLYRADERSFRTFGLGEISDAYKVTVTRERNGNYDLYIKYPVNGHFASIFKEEMKIKADAGKRTKWQTFEINRIVKNSSEHIEIYARHISMRTSDLALKPIVRSSQVNAETALRLWKESLVGDDVFDVSSDIQTIGSISWDIDKIGNARKALGGASGSILDVFGGEYEFDNNLIILHKQMGRKAPTVLEYGRNLLSVEEERLLDGNYTSIYPFARYTPSGEESHEVLVTLPEHILDSPYLRLYAQRRISLVDFSGKFDDKHPPTAEKLRSLGQSYIKSNNIGAPKISTEVSYVDLSQTLDYQDFGVMEEVELCDIIPLYYPQFDITTTTEKVVKVVYDVYTDSNEEITLGAIGQSLSSSMTAGIADRLSVIEERQASIEGALPQYLISGTGNKIWYETPSKNVEHKIGDTWFEKNGQYQRMYIWNGSMWEKVLDTEDVDRVKKEVDKQFEAVNTKMAGIEAKHDQKVSDLLKKSNATQELAEASKRLAQEAKNASSSTGQELSRYKQDNERNLSVLRNQATQIDGKAVQALNKANQTAAETTSLIANLRTDLDGKVSLADFQSVRETSKLYERILGGAENDISNNVSRLVMTNEIFQTEVGKYSTQGGPNMLRNSRADDELKYWTEANGRLGFTAHKFYFNGQKRMFELRPGAVVKSPRFIVKRSADYTLNILGFDNNSKYFRVYFCKRKKGSNADFEEKQLIFDGTPQWTNGPVFNNEKNVKKTFKFNVGDFDDGYLQFEYDRNNPNKWGGLFMTELDFYEGSNDRKWQPAPEDSAEPIEAVRTQVTQLAGSYSIRNLNSPGDVMGAINLNPDGSVKINEGLISVGEKTYIKDGVIKKSMIGNAQIGTAHIGEIDASQARIINISAKNVVADGLTGNIIRGGKLTSLNGVTDFDLQTGWIDMNGFGVGIKNQFPNRPLQYLVFGAGNINGVEGSYTALLSNRNGLQQMDHTSAGLQIWNGRTGNSIQSAINMYGRRITFNQSAQAGLRELAIETDTNTISGVDEILIQGVRLSYILNDIYDNFRNLAAVPGNYSRGYYSKWK